MPKEENKPKGMEEFFEKLGKLEPLHKILICVGTAIVLIGPMVYFMYMPQWEEITKLEKEVKVKKDELAKVKRKAAELPKVQKKMKDLQMEFNIARKALPEKEEIPSLLTSISRSGKDSGLEFKLFKPQKEVLHEFYADIPVKMKVTGGFHAAVSFFDKIARLSRTVNVRDITLKVAVSKKDSLATIINMDCTAVTYKFLKEGEGKKKKKKKK